MTTPYLCSHIATTRWECVPAPKEELTVGILGEDSLVGLQGLGVALVVDGGDAELVLVAGFEALDVEVRRRGGSGALRDRHAQRGSRRSHVSNYHEKRLLVPEMGAE